MLKATSNTASMSMTSGIGVNGFWRIGRPVSRVMMENDNAKLNAINDGPATTNCMAYQYKYDIIRCRNLKEIGWGALGATMSACPRASSSPKETAKAIECLLLGPRQG